MSSLVVQLAGALHRSKGGRGGGGGDREWGQVRGGVGTGKRGSGDRWEGEWG